ncbi:hypothetical protein BDU57DRAFT_523348 [Ampelomyces quisqualis]|uniref:Uncharacterized protein n=1 Tax=Ampelomyces quisqualis TaxID=50730 RepID=A0A6A5Q9D5_AMPQU|nr:hypothetical protein BDU57DRAFT_523348 [Ampelomyces quisqualis]
MADSNMTISAHSKGSVNSRPLSGVNNYTDEYGRTSCGSSELEHYRLRGVGLVKAANSIATAIYRANTQFERLQTFLRASGNKSSATTELFKNIAQVMAERNDRVRAKSRLDRTLNMVTKKYTNLIVGRMFTRVREALPQELVDVVWQHVVQESLSLEINGQIHVVPLRHGQARLLDHEGDLTRSWYFDTEVVGQQTANELRKIFWDSSTFRFEDRDSLGRFLTIVIPRYGLAPHSSHENILVRASNLRIGNPESRADLVRYLTLIGNPRNYSAAITLDIGSADPNSRSEFAQKRPRDYDVHENIPHFTAAEEQQAQDTAHLSKRARASLDDPAFVMLVRDLGPLLSCLFVQGHTSYITDENTCWRWGKDSGKIEGDVETRCARCFTEHRQLDYQQSHRFV